jgi:hypothetical protein
VKPPTEQDIPQPQKDSVCVSLPFPKDLGVKHVTPTLPPPPTLPSPPPLSLSPACYEREKLGQMLGADGEGSLPEDEASQDVIGMQLLFSKSLLYFFASF